MNISSIIVKNKNEVNVNFRPCHCENLMQKTTANMKQSRLWTTVLESYLRWAAFYPPFMRFDKNLLLLEGSMGKPRLHVKYILATKFVVWCRYFSLGVNSVYCGLKSCIFIDGYDVWITGSSKCFIHLPAGSAFLWTGDTGLPSAG